MTPLRLRLLALVTLTLLAGSAIPQAGARGAGGDSEPIAQRPVLSRWLPSTAAPAFSSRAAAPAAAKFLTASSFTDTGPILSNDLGQSATPVDYDSDGRLDVLSIGCSDPDCTNAVARLYRNNGDGTFSENTSAGLPGIFGGVASWADYDSDGHADVLIAGCADWFCSTTVSRLFRNNGNGTFSENTSAGLPGLFTFSGETSITWADYDNDGRSDVLLTGIGDVGLIPNVANMVKASGIAPANVFTKLFRNRGDGTFSEVTNAGFPGTFLGMAAWSDYDADGRADVLINGCADVQCSASVAKLYRNNGDGSFSENTRLDLPDVDGGWIAWGDYDGDGLPDLVLNGYTDPFTRESATWLYRNNGDGTFTENTAAHLPGIVGALVIWGDYDSDGRLDVVLNGYVDNVDSDSITSVYRNNGDGTFSEDATAGLPAVFAWFSWGDFNSDGRPDLLMYRSSSGVTGIYRNDSPAAANPPIAPRGLTTRLETKRWITFAWDASASKTATNSMTYNLRVGTTPGASDIVSPVSTPGGTRQLVEFGNAEGRTFAKVKMPRRGTYYWSVQAIGAGYVGSAFAEEQSFTKPAAVSLELSKKTIYSCASSPRSPRSTTVSGSITPSLLPKAKVFLQWRYRSHAPWRRMKAAWVSNGKFSFAAVGKGFERSFWVRAVVRSKVEIEVVSPSRKVKVKNPAVCAKK